MLVPVTRNNLPPAAINVPGPGPPDPRKPEPAAPAEVAASLPRPPLPSGSSSELIGTNGGNVPEQESTEDGEGEPEDDYAPTPTVPSDPYANLDNAFGGYLADEPRPQMNDLLFRAF